MRVETTTAMDAESHELQRFENRDARNSKSGEEPVKGTESNSTAPPGDPFLLSTGLEYEAECCRYDLVRDVIGMGNGLQLDELLGQWQEKDLLRDWRTEENLTLYADAITDGYTGKVLNCFVPGRF